MGSLHRSRAIVPIICVLLTAVTAAVAQEWWERPWDYKVAPKAGADAQQAWYLDSVNDLGGTPERDNQRDISKGLGRIRKFRVQTLYRLNELRDVSELMEMQGAMGSAAAEAAPHFDRAEAALQEAIRLQKAGDIAAARERIDAALEALGAGERIAETAIAIQQERRHVQHLRNAASYAQMPELQEEIDAFEQNAPAAMSGMVRNLPAALEDLRRQIDALGARVERLDIGDAQREEFARALALYDYLLECVAKDGPREEHYEGDLYRRDAEVSDLTLGATSTLARRAMQLRFRLRQLTNRMSAATGQPVTDSLSDRISAKLGWPIDDLDYFTRSKFGIVRSLRLMGNQPWDWEFNYTPPQADAMSLAGRWRFRLDPAFEGDEQGWQAAEIPADGWRTLYAPNAWERQGVHDWNPIANLQRTHRRVTGQELEFRPDRGYEHMEHRHYNGVAWYRKTVVVPQVWEGSDVRIECAVPGGRFRVWVNGQSAGDEWQSGRSIRIPADVVRFGQPNALAVACYNDAGNGGFVEGNLWLVRDGGTATWRMTPLGGGWANEERFGTPAGTVRVNTASSSASPACLLATDDDEVYLWGWSMKGYSSPVQAVFPGEDGLRRVALDGDKRIAAGDELAQNWLLLTVPAAQGDDAARPVLVVFQRRPREIRWSADTLREGLTATFDGSAGQIGLVRPGRAGDDEAALVERARLWSRALRAYPEHASEFWTIDPARPNLAFEIMGRFTLVYNYHATADDWGTEPLTIAGLPSLSCYALDHEYPGFAEGDWQRTGVPVNYQAYAQCEFRAKSGTDRLTYEAPAADHATLWRGVGTLFQEVWGPAAETTRKWGSNNNRAGFAFHQDWQTQLTDGFALRVRPQDYEEWQEVDQTVELNRRVGLFLFILDFSNDQERDEDSLYYPHSGGYLRDKPETITNLGEFWRAMATRYRDVPADELGYNFNNEPCTIDVETYDTLIRTLTAAVRSVDTEKWLTIDFGDGWAQADFVFATRPTGDPKTAYNYHLYYKHDRIIEGRVPELFFPQYNEEQPLHWNNSLDLFVRRIEDTFVYQAVHHVPVWCGEFGGSINNPNQEMLIWCEDYVAIMERLGHGWSWWNWSGANYGGRTGLQDGEVVNPAVLVLKRFMSRKGAF